MMIAVIPQDEAGWISALSAVEIPVLQRSIDQLERMRENESRIVARDISRVLLHDPMFTLRVLRFLQRRRGGRLSTEITTVEHALMMLGVSPFFTHFNGLPSIELALASFPQALTGLMRVLDRARHAALYARDWAGIRCDIESDEVVIAALLHDLAEILLWCFAPEQALRIEALQRHDRAMRSSAAQRSVLGFTLADLQVALIAEWNLPALLQTLMHETRPKQPRTLNVLLAVDLARHSASGWDDPALPDDYAEIQKLLNLSEAEVLERIQRIALLAQIEQEPSAVEAAAALAQKATGSGE